MISLQDKITKFQKLLYNKELQDFIPIDDQFIGGGVTMQSLIKENAFVVEELKKMKNVFVNYCKLNQTVYEKINQHEIALHSETNKVVNISHTVQNKLHEAITQVKQMYEEMQHQSTKTEQLVHQAVKPIEQAVSKKVDQASFTIHMKRIIRQLQDGEISLQQEETLQSQSQFQSQSQSQNPLLSDEPIIRKKKNKFLSHQEYHNQKESINKLFKQINFKIQQIQNKNQQYDPILYKNTSNINKINLILDNNQTQIFKLNRQTKQTRTIIHSIEQRLINQINSKTHDNVWQRKFNAFQNSSVLPKFQSLSNEINKNQKQNNKLFADLQPKFKTIKQNIQNLQEENRQNKSLIKFHQQSLTQAVQNVNSQFTKINQKINAVQIQTDQKIIQVQQKINHQIALKNKQIQNLIDKIKDLSKTIEDKVFSTVKKNIDVKISQIDKNIHALKTKQKTNQQQLFHMKGEINSIKEVLSKKANFTDILMHFERKADKQDFKQLRQKIQTAPSHLKSTILNSPQRTRRTISANSQKRSSFSRNLGNGSQLMNEDKNSMESQKQKGSRLFIMGLQNDMGLETERRMSYTQSTRRKKKIKSSIGVLNLFS